MYTVFREAPDVVEVRLYGSRAKGTAQPGSNVDLALVGVRDPLRAEAIAEELEELPLPYRFDVRAYDAVGYAPLREHIARVGITLYRRVDDTSATDAVEPSHDG
jgi:predicted nucleotidyltransferase